MLRKIEINGLLTLMEEYYGVVLPDTRKRLFIEDLVDLDPVDIDKAWRLYRQDPKYTKFPLPAQLRGFLKPSDDQEARDAVSRIVRALHLYADPYGHTSNADRVQKAKDWIGGLGWTVVERMGGWMKLSQMGELDASDLAQWRELAVSLMVKFRLGTLDQAPALGYEKKAVGQLESMGDFAKRLVDRG